MVVDFDLSKLFDWIASARVFPQYGWKAGFPNAPERAR
jgi:hypothetical protein